MNNVKLKIGALAVIAGMYSAGASAETKTGEAKANVIEPLIIDALLPMDFTDISGGTNGGTLAMANDGSILPGGDAIVIGGGGGTALRFDITGELNQSVVITVTNTPVLSNGTVQMGLVMNAVPGSPLTTTGSAQSVSVGGTLTVSAGQAGGAYSTNTTGGTPVVITANYQ